MDYARYKGVTMNDRPIRTATALPTEPAMPAAVSAGRDIVLAATLDEARWLVAKRYPGARPASVSGETSHMGVRIATCYVMPSARSHPDGARAIAIMRREAAKARGAVYLLEEE